MIFAFIAARSRCYWKEHSYGGMLAKHWAGPCSVCTAGLPSSPNHLSYIITITSLWWQEYGCKLLSSPSHNESFLATRQKEPNADDNNSFPDEIKRVTEERTQIKKKSNIKSFFVWAYDRIDNRLPLPSFLLLWRKFLEVIISVDSLR